MSRFRPAIVRRNGEQCTQRPVSGAQGAAQGEAVGGGGVGVLAAGGLRAEGEAQVEAQAFADAHGAGARAFQIEADGLT